MNLLPRQLWARIVLALAVAAGAVAALAWFVENHEPELAPTLRGAPVAAATEGGVRARTSSPRDAAIVTRSLSDLEHPEPAPVVAHGVPVRPVVGTVAVARRLASLPPDIAPVVEVLPEGSLVLRRTAPLPTGPIAVATRSRDGHGAGLVLGQPLDRLTAPARTALLGLLGRWFPERPVPVERLVPIDEPWSEPDLRRLLSWVR